MISASEVHALVGRLVRVGMPQGVEAISDMPNGCRFFGQIPRKVDQRRETAALANADRIAQDYTLAW